MESLIIAYDKNMHWIYPDLNSVLSKKFHFLWNGPVANEWYNYESAYEIGPCQYKAKHCYYTSADRHIVK